MGEKDISSTSAESPGREESLREGRVVLVNAADETHDLVKKHDATVGELTPEKLSTLKRKLYLRVVLLATVINFMLFVSDENAQFFDKRYSLTRLLLGG
jgi:hypothetical protein